MEKANFGKLSEWTTPGAIKLHGVYWGEEGDMCILYIMHACNHCLLRRPLSDELRSENIKYGIKNEENRSLCPRREYL